MQYTHTLLEEELKKGEKLSVGWPWRLLIFSFLVFAIAIIVYFGMLLGYKPFLNSQIENLNQEIAYLSQQIDEEQQRNLVEFYSQLINVKTLSENHVITSKFLEFLETNTHQDIYYFSLNLSFSENSARIEGVVPNYDILSQQLESFRTSPEVERISLEDSQRAENGVRFTVRLFLKSEIFR